jgi:hypothetical protein
VSPSALLEIEEKTQELIHLDQVRGLIERIYALDVSTWADDHFAELEDIIDTMIRVLAALPLPEHRPLIKQLLDAREGVEQGVAPDPAKRPSADEMRAFVSAHL